MGIETRLVEYRDGNRIFEGMLARDEALEGPRPGVLVAHTIRGRSGFEEDRARTLAEMGYAGFAIDVYGKEVIGSEFDDCRRMMEGLRSDRATLQQRLLLAVGALRAQSSRATREYRRQTHPGAHTRTAWLGRSARDARRGRRTRRGIDRHGRRLAAALLR